MNRLMLYFTVMNLINQALLAMSDGRITPDEVLALVKAVARIFDVDLDAGELTVFIEQDDDAHIIIKASLLRKLQIDVSGMVE